MKPDFLRIVKMPVIHDDRNHYLLNGDTGYRAILAEDLPRPTLPINSIVDDMIEQQEFCVVSCDYCDCKVDLFSPDALIVTDGNYCDVDCFNRAPCRECNTSWLDCQCSDG